MKPSIKVRRAAIRCAYIGLRLYWFVFRPRVVGVKCVVRHDDDVLLVRHTYGPPDLGLARRHASSAAARRLSTPPVARCARSSAARSRIGSRSASYSPRATTIATTCICSRRSIGDPQLDIDLTELAQANWFRRDQLPPDVGRHVGEILARAAAASRS